MTTLRIVTLAGLLLVGTASIWSQPRGYILKPDEGERLPGVRPTIIKASPQTGTQGVEAFRDTMAAGSSTGIHVHLQADEFFYVVRGAGVALVGNQETPITADDFIFIPKGHDHRVRNAGPAPLELLFLVDRPGLVSDFREARGEEVRRKRRLTLEERNRISQTYGTIRKTLQ